MTNLFPEYTTIQIRRSHRGKPVDEYEPGNYRTPPLSWKRGDWLVMAAAQTDVGNHRTYNEDDYLIAPESSLCAVADGLGGAHSQAAALVLQTIDRAWEGTCRRKENPDTFCDAGQRLVKAALASHQALVQRAEDDLAWHGHASTLAVLHLCCDRVVVGHVGDARIYRWREGVLTPWTQDHTLLWELRQQANEEAIEDLETAFVAYQSVITQALGFGQPKLELANEPAQVGTSYLLCSDGLHKSLSDDEIATIWSHTLRKPHADLGTVCANLLAEGRTRHENSDNLTALIVHLVDNQKDERLAEQKRHLEAWEEALFVEK